MLYQPEGEVRLEVRVENETVWLTQAQMAKLFNKDQSSIIVNIFFDVIKSDLFELYDTKYSVLVEEVVITGCSFSEVVLLPIITI